MALLPVGTLHLLQRVSLETSEIILEKAPNFLLPCELPAAFPVALDRG